MLSDNSKFILNILFCVFGILSGLSGGLSFNTLFHNEPAMMWAYYSGCTAFACLVIELLRHQNLVHVCCTRSSLWIVMLYAGLSCVTSSLLFLIHFSVGLRNREAVSGKSALDHSDFIVAVWAFMSAKFCLKLYLVAKKAREALLHCSVVPRAESPDFQAMGRQGVYSESLDSHLTGRRPRRQPGDNRRARSSSGTRRTRRDRPTRSNDGANLLSDVSYLPTVSQLAAASDSESAGDMDETAHRLTLDL